MFSLANYPWQDAHKLAIPELTNCQAASLLTAFLAAPPQWVHRLMRLRDRLVTPFGLKPASAPLRQAAPPLQIGECFGIFRVLASSADTVLLGEDDWHLDFRILLRWQASELTVITAVRTKHWAGRLYMALVTPFHHLIVAWTLPRMRAHLLAQQEA